MWPSAETAWHRPDQSLTNRRPDPASTLRKLAIPGLGTPAAPKRQGQCDRHAGGTAMKRMSRVLVTVLALTITIPAAGWAQERVGVATTVVGPVTITHVTAPAEPLKFKDDILLNDRIATGDKALTRVLLGGKALVTAREHSVLVIREVPGTSTIDLASGRISVAVDKAKMRPGDLVEIRTPNAVAGIRGTVVVAEARGNVSTITVLRGLVDVYRLDPGTGKVVGSATSVGAHESVTVHHDVLPTKAQTISADMARRLSNQFTTPVRGVHAKRDLWHSAPPVEWPLRVAVHVGGAFRVHDHRLLGGRFRADGWGLRRAREART